MSLNGCLKIWKHGSADYDYEIVRWEILLKQGGLKIRGEAMKGVSGDGKVGLPTLTAEPLLGQ